MAIKLKRIQRRYDPETDAFEGCRKVRGPQKKHEMQDYTRPGGKPGKAARAEYKRQLRERYGPAPDTPRPLNPMCSSERQRLRAEVLSAAGYRCEACGDPRRLTLDHIVPRHLGGGHHRENLQALCHPCNVAKGLDIWKAGDGRPRPAAFL